ncbi:MAG TPA: hypothetical protein PKL31_09480 [Fulvivirga sp.]|nr:hypothetical protein [Fulvivirga sp.]
MNTLINKKNLILLVLAVIFISPVLAAEKEKEDSSNELNYELLDPFYSYHAETVTLEFYDSNDNLVYKTTVSKDSPCNAELAKYLNVSDFLVESGDTSYFRLNN